MRATFAATLATFAFAGPATALQCPTDYHVSGNYCVPNPGANPGPAIPKVGTCPTDYHASGDFCLGNRNAKPALIRRGSRPTGYHPSGEYCLSSGK